MKSVLAAAALSAAALCFPARVEAATTAPPLLTITAAGKQPRSVPVFDKWTDGMTVATGDLGTDGVPEIVAGAGPGSLPEVRVLRQDGGLITKFNAFDERFRGGVTVAVSDVDRDGRNDIVVGAGPGGGPHVKVFDGYGKSLFEFFAWSAAFRGGVQVEAGFGQISTAMLAGADQRVRTWNHDGTAFQVIREVPRTPPEPGALASAALPGVTYSAPPPTFGNGKPDVAQEIVVNLAKQRLYAFEHGWLKTTFLVSTGLARFPTPPGNYAVMSKVAKMDYRGYYGPGSPYNYNLKNVKWNTMFIHNYFIHQAYWHDNFGNQMSHGCVNAREGDAKIIHDWADIGTPVIVRAS